MSDDANGLKVRFMKVFEHDEVLRTVPRGHRDVLDRLVAMATATGRCHFTIDIDDREKMARTLKCKEKSIANALSALSRPTYDDGPELLIRLKASRYMLNPAYYFIGYEPQRQTMIETVASMRQARRRDRKRRTGQPARRAKVTRLHAVGSAP